MTLSDVDQRIASFQTAADGEFELQRKGYAATLTDPRVLKAIQATRNGTVAVCFVEWSGADDQQVVLEWTEFRDAEDGGAVAAAIVKAPRSFTGRTSRSPPTAAAQEGDGAEREPHRDFSRFEALEDGAGPGRAEELAARLRRGPSMRSRRLRL